MAVTQYIGSRYVPVFADPAEWSSTKSYEPLTIVLHEGNSFTSKQYVPVGVDINDTKYWAETGNYNAQIEQYRREVTQLKDDVEQEVSQLKDDVEQEVSQLKDDVEQEVTQLKDDVAHNYIRTFNTVVDMKEATDLKVGSVCHTLGFNSINDNGGSFYVISSTGNANNIDVIRCVNGYANLIIDEYITIASFGISENSDISNVANYVLENYGKIDLCGKHYTCAENIYMHSNNTICNGYIAFESGKQLITSDNCIVENINFNVNNQVTDGIVYISNAYSSIKGSTNVTVKNCNFIVYDESLDVTLIKMQAFNDSMSPTGSVPITGVYGNKIQNVNIIGSALYGKFLTLENSGGWTTTIEVENCWMGSCVLGIETIYEGTGGSYMADIYISNVHAQYHEGVNRFGYFAYGSYIISNSFTWDLPSTKHQILAKATGVRIGLESAYHMSGDTVCGYIVDGVEESYIGAVLSGPISTLYATPIPRIAGNTTLPDKILPMSSSVRGYEQLCGITRSSLTSDIGENGFLGNKLTFGHQLIPNVYAAGGLGISYYPSLKPTPAFCEWSLNSDDEIVRTLTPLNCGVSGAYGPSANRPTNAKNGACMFDTTLHKPIWFYSNKWYDSNGTEV